MDTFTFSTLFAALLYLAGVVILSDAETTAAEILFGVIPLFIALACFFAMLLVSGVVGGV